MDIETFPSPGLVKFLLLPNTINGHFLSPPFPIYSFSLFLPFTSLSTYLWPFLSCLSAARQKRSPKMRSLLRFLALCAAVSLCVCYGIDTFPPHLAVTQQILFYNWAHSDRGSSLMINPIPCFSHRFSWKHRVRWRWLNVKNLRVGKTCMQF